MRRETPNSEGYRIFDTTPEVVDSLSGVFPVCLYLAATFVALSATGCTVDEKGVISDTFNTFKYSDRVIR